MLDFLHLGAVLYIPATHSNLEQIINREKFPFLKSIIIDTEDSIFESDLENAYSNINKIFENFQKNDLLIFFRVRNENELEKIYNMPFIEKINGLVFPKLTISNIQKYFQNINNNLYYMPILEQDIFDMENLKSIRNFLLDFKKNILCIRMGATDILGSLALRKGKYQTIYKNSIMNNLISNIISVFKPYGFNISGTVFESFDDISLEVFKKEVSIDISNGLFAKTVIHPLQANIIHELYKVNNEEYEEAKNILDDSLPAVFSNFSRMNERIPHKKWAESIIKRADIYGIA